MTLWKSRALRMRWKVMMVMMIAPRLSVLLVMERWEREKQQQQD